MGHRRSRLQPINRIGRPRRYTPGELDVELSEVISWEVTLLVAVIAALPGLLAFLNQRRGVDLQARKQKREERAEDTASAIDGFARLVVNLEQEVERKERDCERRIESLRRELLQVIADLEGQLQQAKVQTLKVVDE
jgi:hypothetical protein